MIDSIEPKHRRLVLFLLFFASGMAGLIYEILWMKELGRLFGNTAYAVATTLAVFFSGLSVGGYAWGKKARSLAHPLKTYGLLELGIALTAGLYFFILDAYRAIYAPLFDLFSGHTFLFVLVKLVLAMGILFPPAFFMGGTFPVMSQHLIRRPGDLSRLGTALYALNTIGAAAGAFLAGFILPALLGFTVSYLAAIGISLSIGLIALVLSRTDPSPVPRPAERMERPQKAGSGRLPTTLGILAFASGFLTLGLEVFWTRMFSQTLQNSVYMFSALLIVFLLALACGSWLANLLGRLNQSPMMVLAALLAISGMAVLYSPDLFFFTSGLDPDMYKKVTFGSYLFLMFKSLFLVLFIPCVLIGCCLPYLLKAAQGRSDSPGYIVGRLISINTAGAISGSLVSGFVCLNWLGLWNSIRLFALLYSLQALWLALTHSRDVREKLAVGLAVLPVFLLAVVMPRPLPLVSYDRETETLIDVMEGSQATVSVIRDPYFIRMRFNNHYGLGSSKSPERQRFMGRLPFYLHPHPRNVFFLGLGTGMTAGAALGFPLEKLTVCELSSEVVTLSQRHFTPYLNGLFQDPRARVVVEDGRNYLLGKDERFDLIVADLFLPWKAGVGSLFTRDHFQVVKSRLKEDGIFFQWLPCYQFSMEEYATIARTMLETFGLVTLWRVDFLPATPFMALAGHNRADAFQVDTMIQNDRMYRGQEKESGQSIRQKILPLYAGNISATRELIPPGPVNTDDRPILEYRSPVTIRSIFSGKAANLAGIELYNYLDRIFQAAPPDKDPYLRNLSPSDQALVRAGLARFGYECLKNTDPEKAKELKAEADILIPPAKPPISQ